ncbi:MAG: hypothetical protein AAFQ65_15160 [Myxococcota bacterium]
MDMSHDYVRRTVEALSERGFSVDPREKRYESDEIEGPNSQCFDLRLGDAIHWTLETVFLGEGEERYFLEVHRYYGMRGYSYPLDSWKFFPDRIEFKYEVNPESSMGPSLIFYFDDIPELAQGS